MPVARASFFGRWLLGTAVGWLAGVLLALGLSYVAVEPLLGRESNIIVGLVLGAAVGLGQRVAVRVPLELGGRWIWAAAVGLGLPFAAGEVVAPWLGVTEASAAMLVSVTASGGGLAGLLQVSALRPHVRAACAWVPVSLVSWGAAWAVADVWPAAGVLLGGVALGVVSGLALVAMRRLETPPGAD